MDNLHHLHVDYRPIALHAAEDRIEWIRQDRWIHYDRAEQILARLDDLLCYPPRDRMPSLLLFGATGMGKTRIIQKFLRDHQASFDESAGITRLPVAYLQMPPQPWERDFYEQFMIGLGAVVPTGMTAASLRHHACVLAHQLEVRMLVVDEIHAMLAGTFREQRVFLNALRFLANELRLPLVCVGTHEAKRALMTDQQLADRFEARELPAWRDDASLRQLLSSFMSILPLRHASDLLEAKTRKRILGLADGVMGRICRIMEVAAVDAIRTGKESISLDSFNDEMAAHTLVSISDRRRRRATV